MQSNRSLNHSRMAIVAATLLALASGLAVSQDAPAVKPDQAVKYRQSVYKVILWNFGPMAAMVRGQAPWDQEEFARRAERVATMAPMLIEGYPRGSGPEAGVHTRARPELWSNMEEFRSLMKTMETRAADLANVARGGDADKTRAAFGELGKACGACHDKYRTD
jgi:cytochrome c556